MIVPGTRIGMAELDPGDQGALVRELGEPDQSERVGDREYYRFGGGEPLVVDFDLAADAPFEISTVSGAYRTRGGLGVGSTESQVLAQLGAPLCQGRNGDDGLLVYDGIWFLLSRGTVAKVSIRQHLGADDFQKGALHC